MKPLFQKIVPVFIITIIFTFFELAVFIQSAGAQPANDECNNAIEVFDGLNAYTNVNATNSPPPWSCAPGAADVWFEYTATCTGDVVLDTCTGTDYDSTIEVFDTGSCADVDTANVVCNDDSCGLQSSVTQTVTVGEVYIIRIGGWGGSQGSGNLDIIPQSNCRVANNIPTLSEWGLIAMAAILGVAGFIVIHKRKVTA